MLDGDTDGFVKSTPPGTDRHRRGDIVARHAGEMISELTLAMVGGLGLKTLARTIHPYPTQADAIRPRRGTLHAHAAHAVRRGPDEAMVCVYAMRKISAGGD